MTEEERDNGLESLFRNKLEENEMVPGSDLTGRFMVRLGRREFFRFNPFRFNVYYLTVAVAGLMVAGLMLLSDPREEAGIPQPEPGNGSVAAVTPEEVRTEPKTAAVTESDAPSVTGQQNADVKDAPAAITAGESHERESVITSPGTAGSEITVSTLNSGNQAAVPSPVTVLSIETSVTSGCMPLRVSFRCNASESNKVSWSFGDGGTSPLRETDYIYDIPGRYRVMLTVIDSRGKTYTATVRIEVHERPRAAFEVINIESPEEGGKLSFVNMSEGAVEYLWNFGDGTISTLPDPSHMYDRMGTYDVSLVAYSAEGCPDSVTVSDIFTDLGMYIRFPNVFVPNRGGPTGGYYNTRTDEESQVFHPVASGIAEYNLKIYNRAGLMVFESNDIGMGWDGWHKGELCAPGVYVWKVRGTYRNGQSFVMAGDVTLLNY